MAEPHTVAATRTAGMRRLAFALSPLALLAACGSTGGPQAGAKENAVAVALPEPVLNQGPSARTAVLSTSFSVDGALLPTMRGQQFVETRADMRRTDSLQTFDNRLLRSLAGDGRSADIVRLDRKLLWSINPGKKTYTECPLTGCAKPPADKPKPEQGANPAEPTCPLTLKKNELKVAATGERKAINNFNTERFQINWTMELEDKQGRRNSNRVVLDMWTTPDVGVVKEVQLLNQAFEKRFATALLASDSPLAAYLPREAMGAMTGLMRNVAGKDGKALGNWTSEMKKVRGYPISMNLSWNLEGNACGEGQGNGESGPTTAGGVLGSLMGGGKSGGKGSAALLSFSHEVKSIDIKPVSDSWFAPEAGYQRTN